MWESSSGPQPKVGQREGIVTEKHFDAVEGNNEPRVVHRCSGLVADNQPASQWEARKAASLLTAQGDSVGVGLPTLCNTVAALQSVQLATGLQVNASTWSHVFVFLFFMLTLLWLHLTCCCCYCYCWVRVRTWLVSV